MTPSRDARRVAEKLYEQFWTGKFNSKRHGCTVRDLLAIAIRAELAAVRRMVRHKNNTKCNATILRGKERVIFFNGYNKACDDILVALNGRK